MTYAEMCTDAKLLYEDINSSSMPGFSPTEWGQLLTVAQYQVVENILKEGVNKNAFNQVAIDKLIQPAIFNTFTTDTHFKNVDLTGTNAKKLVLSAAEAITFAKYFWILDEYVNSQSANNIPLKRISYDFYRININNPFRKPNTTEGFWIIQFNNIPVFITDGSSLIGYYIVGVQHPNLYPISSTTNCILGVGIHPKIVEEAVKLARMSITDPQGYQLAMAEFNK